MKNITCAQICAFALFFIPFVSNAQKLPTVQQNNLRAPADVKIDGKADEWGGKFQAYNRATDIFYTMANDDKNLYLVIQAVDPLIITKIISGGITLSISKSAKKNDDKGIVSVTYPIFDIKNKPNLNLKNKPNLIPGSEASIKRADSLINVINNLIRQKSKYIQVIGIKGLDTLTSVYNEDGIKAAELFNNQMVYTMELGISLKQLGLSIDDPAKFYYYIKSNGSKVAAMNGITVTKDKDGVPIMTVISPSAFTEKGELELMNSTTDFSGEYILAK